MAETPFWFGSSERPLFGWLHVPESGTARAGVILCPPLGIEAICVYYSYRQLATRLTEAGLAVLRFDYDGTGDSFGGQADPDRVGLWQRSITHAVDALKNAGADAVAIVGIRMGALLGASEALRRGGVEALVLWDPCLSGQAFLREQKAFRMLSLGGEVSDDGSVEAPGVLFPPEAVTALGAVDLLKTQGDLAARILVLEDPERPHSRRLEKRLAEASADWHPAEGQSALLDPPRQETPTATIEWVAAWLSEAFVKDEPRKIETPTWQRAGVGRDQDAAEIIEYPVRLGPLDLFGIVTEVEGHPPGPTMVFIDEGNTPHIGQSRMWVEFARTWAAHGLRVVRFDLSGIGDSGVRAGQRGHVTRALEAFEDVRDAAAAISPADPSNVVLIGLCSGAYQALEAGLTLTPRGICMINPILTFNTAEAEPDTRRLARQSTKRWFVSAVTPVARALARRQARPDPDRWINSLEIANWPAAIARRFPRIPEPIWWSVKRLLLQHPSHLVIEKVLDAGVDVQVVVGPDDLMPIEMGARHALARMRRSERFQLDVLEGLDHAGLIVEQRSRLMDAVTERILSRYGPSA